MTQDNVSFAGNMLAGPQVIEATMQSFEANAHLPFAQRLITALSAGEVYDTLAALTDGR